MTPCLCCDSAANSSYQCQQPVSQLVLITVTDDVLKARFASQTSFMEDNIFTGWSSKCDKKKITALMLF